MATVAIIPGSFAPASHYDLFADTLSQHGINSQIIDIPSVGKRDGLPPQTMSDDVAEIVRVVEPLLDAGKQVVLMTHSYGGIPGTQSLKQLSRKAREAEGKVGGVDKIVYVTSVVLQVGVANLDLFGDNLPDSITINDDYMYLAAEANAPLTFSDLPAEQGLALAKQMSWHSTPSFKEKLTYAGYNDVEVHYVVCKGDMIVPLEYQYAMIELVKASSGREVGVHELDCGHAPTTSQPNNVAKIFKDVV